MRSVRVRLDPPSTTGAMAEAPSIRDALGRCTTLPEPGVPLRETWRSGARRARPDIRGWKPLGRAKIAAAAHRSDGWERAAVDDVFGAGDRGGAIRDEEGDEFGDLVGLGRSPEGDSAEGVHDLL